MINIFLKIRNAFLMLIFKTLKIRNNYIFGRSFHGLYADNPKHFAINLSNKINNAKVVWEISKKSNTNLLPKEIICVSPGSIKAIYYQSISKYILDNYLGIYYAYFNGRGIKERILKNLYKKRGQINVSFWHGTPLKKINIDNKNEKSGSNFVSTLDYLALDSEFLLNVLSRNMPNYVFDNKIIKAPSCKNLYSKSIKDNNQTANLKSTLKIPVDKKVVLYAPTFRENNKDSIIDQVCKLKVEAILKSLSLKFGGDWCFVVRFHDSFVEYAKEKGIIFKDIINGNIGDDMADYLAVSDVVITDYSGCIFDSLFIGIPTFLYCFDYDEYKNKERDFYFSFSDLPFPTSYSEKQLINSIVNFSSEKYQSDISLFERKVLFYKETSCKTDCIELIMKK